MDAQHTELFRLAVSSVGNFRGHAPAQSPWYVALVANGKTRAMSMAPPDGDCNSCHTQAGANGAPGRILLP